jgi:hypothetical protein
VKAGSFSPGQHSACLHAMAGDDCSLHFDLDELTPRQQADHESNIELTGMLQCALLLLGKRSDRVALYEEFLDEPWAALLDRYRDLHSQLLPETVPAERCSYHPSRSFYASLAAGDHDCPLCNLYMVSGSNAVLHRDPQALAVSRDLNSKLHFASHAPGFGLPVPDTLVCTRATLGESRVGEFLARHGNSLMLKTLGLAGARNVISISSLEEAEQWLSEYAPDMPVLLQQRLPLADYTEMTADLRVTRDQVSIENLRQILFADELWVGNLVSPRLRLSPEQEDELLRVGRYAIEQGYGSDEGSNCGVDFFVGPAGELLITEINARWTGGLFPCEALRQMGAGDRQAVVFFDVAGTGARNDYLDFQQRYLPGRHHGPFDTVPLGFAPFEQAIEGQSMFYVWQMVLGDFPAFQQRKAAELGGRALLTADRIKLP